MSSSVPDDATVAGSGKTIIGSRETLRRDIPVDVLFGGRSRLLIGRAPECDVCLPHPTISRQHAALERVPGGLQLSDLGSVNGVTVDGARLGEPLLVKERQRVGIGPYLFTLSGGLVQALDSSRSLRLEARRLEKTIAVDGGTRKLLDDINLVVEPGEFVSLLGPSGSGKSTLMDCLNGRRRATGGVVLANGEDFYRHYDSFRQSLGYVPQRDIVHSQLSVYRALYYTARLRLPTDTNQAELSSRIEQVIDEMELGPHRGTLVANLSGGQIKRVSLGAELLARPCLLYIDEATSGLDAGTEARMMRLFRRLTEEGKSLVCITHNVDNVDRCHLVLVLMRGRLVFYGPPQEVPAYFRVGRLSEIYDRLADKEPAAWEEEFAASSLHQEFVAKRLAASAVTDKENVRDSSLSLSLSSIVQLARSPHHVPLVHQFGVLTARCLELLRGDPRTLRLVFLQSPIVALFLLLGFVGKPYQHEVVAPRHLQPLERLALEQVEQQLPEGRIARVIGGLLRSEYPVVPDETIVDPRYTYMLLYIVAVAVFWFGCNNAAKEIAKEEAIYGRERAVNLGIVPYLASKFLVLTLISAVQLFLFLLVIFGCMELLYLGAGLETPAEQYRLPYVPLFFVLLVLSVTGVAFGLMLSACVSTPDRANALLPYVLIPQMILGGGIVSVAEGPLRLLALTVSPVYWAYRGIHRGATTLPPDFPFSEGYNDSVWLSCLAMMIQTALLFLATIWFLRRKDFGRA
jgi:ABC-type multidrug transport system ATPase subunit